MSGISFPELRDKADAEGRPFEEVFDEAAQEYFERLLSDLGISNVVAQPTE